MAEPIFITTDKGQKIRILGPFDHDALVAAIDKQVMMSKRDYLRGIFDVTFWTGMRWVEVGRLHNHPEWIMPERQQILLGREAQRKVKRSAAERYIPIPPQLSGVLSYFFKGRKPPCNKVWNDDLTLWAGLAGLGSEGIVPKMTRATIESWMYAAGLPPQWICLRQGHDSLTSLRHYQAIPFTEAERSEIKTRLAGWVGGNNAGNY